MMRTQASRTLFWTFVLGCLLFAPAAMAMQDVDPEDPVGEEETTDFTDAEGLDLDGDGVIDPPPPGQRYCIYTVRRILQGNCPFAAGDVLCIDCPATGACPATANQLRGFRYWSPAGTLVCTGEWTRNIFDAANPNACISCRRGKTGYKFY